MDKARLGLDLRHHSAPIEKPFLGINDKALKIDRFYGLLSKKHTMMVLYNLQ
jgi:hypothetical protein